MTLNVILGNNMNRSFEIHDSTLSAVIDAETTVIVRFNKAYIHQSEGRPGVDDGTGWAQEIELKLTDSEIIKLPTSIPEELIDGHILVNDKIYRNGANLPLEEAGDIELYLQTGMKEELRVRAKSISSRACSEMKYIEEFKA